jgi:hypothetical protein
MEGDARATSTLVTCSRHGRQSNQRSFANILFMEKQMAFSLMKKRNVYIPMLGAGFASA